MAFWEGTPSRNSSWYSTKTDMFHGSFFQLYEYISRNHFDDILGALRYTNKELQCIDPVLEMRIMEELYNNNTEEGFDPGWINVPKKI